MRLLNTDTLELSSFRDREARENKYAILSHTWRDEEVTYKDFQSPSREQLRGWTKIVNSTRLAKRQGWEWIWIDTCCIDKSDMSELSEAINSMFRWYRDASICYAYLEDVSISRSNHLTGKRQKHRIGNGRFVNSRWFMRGWTLQELVAPSYVLFIDKEWREIGSRDVLSDPIETATGISAVYQQNINSACIATKFSWTRGRFTTREEDKAYSLLGIFGIHMPLIYGEGANAAFRRLQLEIMRASDDESIFAWYTERYQPARKSLLADRPGCFRNDISLFTSSISDPRSGFTISNAGLTMMATLFKTPQSILVPLKCCRGPPSDTTRLVLNLDLVRDGGDSLVSLLRLTHAGEKSNNPCQTMEEASLMYEGELINLGPRQICIALDDVSSTWHDTQDKDYLYILPRPPEAEWSPNFYTFQRAARIETPTDTEWQDVPVEGMLRLIAYPGDTVVTEILLDLGSIRTAVLFGFRCTHHKKPFHGLWLSERSDRQPWYSTAADALLSDAWQTGIALPRRVTLLDGKGTQRNIMYELVPMSHGYVKANGDDDYTSWEYQRVALRFHISIT
jgi:hypothetical protein